MLQLAAHVERVPAAGALPRVRGGARGDERRARRRARDRAAVHAAREGAFARTDGRRDFALAPPARSYLQELAGRRRARCTASARSPTCSPASGVGELAPGRDQRARRSRASSELLGELARGLVFVNLIETDQVYGHRKDAHGFAARAARDRRARRGAWLDAPARAATC